MTWCRNDLSVQVLDSVITSFPRTLLSLRRMAASDSAGEKASPLQFSRVLISPHLSRIVASASAVEQRVEWKLMNTISVQYCEIGFRKHGGCRNTHVD